MISYVDLKNIHVLQTNQQQQQQSKLVNKETKKQQQQQQTKKRKIADGRDKMATIPPVLRRTYLVQCKVVRKPKFGNLLLVESGMMGFGIQNSQFK